MTTELPLHSIGKTAPVAPTGVHGAAPSPERKAVLIRRVRFLVAFTIAYNVIEAAVALTAGSIAGSAALLGFGLDSVIEVSSALAVAWQFAGGDHEAREKVALRVIAFQRRTGTELGSHSAVADSKQTLLCTYMSAALLLGLVANSALGWWWADSIAALFIAALAVREGINAWRGDLCCSPAEVFFDHDHDDCETGSDCC